MPAAGMAVVVVMGVEAMVEAATAAVGMVGVSMEVEEATTVVDLTQVVAVTTAVDIPEERG